MLPISLIDNAVGSSPVVVVQPADAAMRTVMPITCNTWLLMHMRCLTLGPPGQSVNEIALRRVMRVMDHPNWGLRSGPRADEA